MKGGPSIRSRFELSPEAQGAVERSGLTDGGDSVRSARLHPKRSMFLASASPGSGMREGQAGVLVTTPLMSGVDSSSGSRARSSTAWCGTGDAVLLSRPEYGFRTPAALRVGAGELRMLRRAERFGPRAGSKVPQYEDRRVREATAKSSGFT